MQSITYDDSAIYEDGMPEMQINLGYVFGQYKAGEIKLAPVRRDSACDSESFITTELQRPRFSDLRMNKVAGGLEFPTGVVTVLGSSDAAKSPLADFLAAGNVIHFGEPLPGHVTQASEACAELIAFLLGDDSDVLSFDSVKNLLTRSAGAAATRGVSRAVFPMLSDWSTVAASLGKTIVVPINISTDSSEAVNEIKEAMRSNVNMHIFASGNAAYDFLTRVPGKGKRKTGSFRAQFGADNRITKVSLQGGLADEVQFDPMVDVAKVDVPSIPLSMFKQFTKE